MSNGAVRGSIKPIQLYREETGNYVGNLYEARKIYPGFVPAPGDFEQNIRLPLLNKHDSETSKVAYFLGVCYAKGSLSNSRGEKFTLPNRVSLTTSSHDLSFLKEYVTPLTEELFNLESVFVAKEIKKQKPGEFSSRVRRDVLYPRITIDSYAIATWMGYDLGAPVQNRQEFDGFPLSYFTTKEQKRDFLLGYLRATSRFDGNQLRIFDSRKGRLQHLKKLMNSFTSARIKIGSNNGTSSSNSKVLSMSKNHAIQLMDDLNIGVANLQPVVSRNQKM